MQQVCLTRADVAARLQVSEKLAGALMREMTCVMVGKRRRVTEEALDAWRREHEIAPGETPAKSKPRRKARRGEVPENMIRTADGRLRFVRV